VPLADLIHPDVVVHVAHIFEAFQENNDIAQTFVNTVTEFLTPEANSLPYFYDTFALYLYFVDKFKGHLAAVPVTLCAHRKLFNTAVCMFYPGKNWTVVNSLRAVVVEMITQKGVVTINQFVQQFLRLPHLFAEVLYRIPPGKMGRIVGEAEVRIRTEMILKSMHYFQSFNNLDEFGTNAIEAARTAIFVHLDATLKDDAQFHLCMNDQLFVDYYCALYCDPSVHSLILAGLADSLRRPENIRNSKISAKVVDLLQAIAREFQKPIALKLADKLLNLLNQVMSLERDYAAVFEPVLSAVMNGIALVSDVDIAPTFMSNLLTFLVHMSGVHQFSQVNVSAALWLMRRVWATEPPHSAAVQLVQWAAGSVSATLNAPFDLKNPKALVVLLSIFEKSPLMNDILLFVRDLCNFSQQNSERMHNDEIDVTLLHPRMISRSFLWCQRAGRVPMWQGGSRRSVRWTLHIGC
jgi:hypothetical protein